jgi:DNA-binding transcriptional LysR family regulator
MRYFVAVGEELHFGRAAERLHISQPALSKAVRRLEQAVGADLLERDSRSVRLTTAGELFLARARAALTAVEEAAALARRAQNGDVGHLGVGYSPATTQSAYRPLRDAFERELPDVDISGREVPSLDLLDDLRAGRVDVALALLAPRLEGLSYQLVQLSPLVAVVPQRHPFVKRKSVAVSDLAGERLLLPIGRAAGRWNETLIRVCQDAGFEPETGELGHHGEADFSLLRDGEATLALRDYVDGRNSQVGAAVVALDPTPRLPIELVWREDDLAPSGLRFLEMAKVVSQAEGWVTSGQA